MKTYEEVLNKWYKPLYGVASLEYIMITEAMKEYAIEVAKQALINASENAYLLDCSMQIKCKYGHGVVVDKQSILSESNIPTLN